MLFLSLLMLVLVQHSSTKPLDVTARITTLLNENISSSLKDKADAIDTILQLLAEIDLPAICEAVMMEKPDDVTQMDNIIAAAAKEQGFEEIMASKLQTTENAVLPDRFPIKGVNALPADFPMKMNNLKKPALDQTAQDSDIMVIIKSVDSLRPNLSLSAEARRLESQKLPELDRPELVGFKLVPSEHYMKEMEGEKEQAVGVIGGTAQPIRSMAEGVTFRTSPRMPKSASTSEATTEATTSPQNVSSTTESATASTTESATASTTESATASTTKSTAASTTKSATASTTKSTTATSTDSKAASSTQSTNASSSQSTAAPSSQSTTASSSQSTTASSASSTTSTSINVKLMNETYPSNETTKADKTPTTETSIKTTPNPTTSPSEDSTEPETLSTEFFTTISSTEYPIETTTSNMIIEDIDVTTGAPIAEAAARDRHNDTEYGTDETETTESYFTEDVQTTEKTTTLSEVTRSLAGNDTDKEEGTTSFNSTVTTQETVTEVPENTTLSRDAQPTNDSTSYRDMNAPISEISDYDNETAEQNTTTSAPVETTEGSVEQENVTDSTVHNTTESLTTGQTVNTTFRLYNTDKQRYTTEPASTTSLPDYTTSEPTTTSTTIATEATTVEASASTTYPSHEQDASNDADTYTEADNSIDDGYQDSTTLDYFWTPGKTIRMNDAVYEYDDSSEDHPTTSFHVSTSSDDVYDVAEDATESTNTTDNSTTEITTEFVPEVSTESVTPAQNEYDYVYNLVDMNTDQKQDASYNRYDVTGAAYGGFDLGQVEYPQEAATEYVVDPLKTNPHFLAHNGYNDGTYNTKEQEVHGYDQKDDGVNMLASIDSPANTGAEEDFMLSAQPGYFNSLADQSSWGLPGQNLKHSSLPYDKEFEKSFTAHTDPKQGVTSGLASAMGVQQKTVWSEPTLPQIFFQPNDYSCPGLFGYYADVSDCQAFFICSWGVPYRFLCPPGTLWSSSLTVCDWSNNVDCSTKKK